MKNNIFKTNNDWTGLVTRLTIGLILFPHGAQNRLGAVITSHLDNGFFMNWAGNQKGEGYEFHLLIIGLALATLINGSGKCSADATIATNNSKQRK